MDRWTPYEKDFWQGYHHGERAVQYDEAIVTHHLDKSNGYRKGYAAGVEDHRALALVKDALIERRRTQVAQHLDPVTT